MYAVKVEEAGPGAGVAVGVAEPIRFRPSRHNVGAAEASWAYSKTGKRGDGVSGFTAYGDPFKTGDIITVDLDFEKDTLRFLLNGIDQGIAFSQTFLGRTIIPAICIGSTEGGPTSTLTLVPPHVSMFDPLHANRRVSFDPHLRVVENGNKWGTAAVAHPGMCSGELITSFRIDACESGGGFTVGVIDPALFPTRMANMGVAPGSWCFSRSGNRSAGTSFEPFGTRMSEGDVVSMRIGINVEDGTAAIEFAVNGVSQGVAFTEEDGLAGRTLVPAVCLGSDEGGRRVAISVYEPQLHIWRTPGITEPLGPG
jgi:hypothetical protein